MWLNATWHSRGRHVCEKTWASNTRFPLETRFWSWSDCPSHFPSVWPGHVWLAGLSNLSGVGVLCWDSKTNFDHLLSLTWFSEQLSYFSHSNSHTFLSATLIVLSQQLSYFFHRTLYYSQKISYAAKHCSFLKSHTSPTFIVVSLSHSPSHSHTISTVHLHILMSGKGLLTL